MAVVTPVHQGELGTRYILAHGQLNVVHFSNPFEQYNPGYVLYTKGSYKRRKMEYIQSIILSKP